jgi:ubiquinone/menaquinone biosynthesis C-methylase UbiE
VSFYERVVFNGLLDAALEKPAIDAERRRTLTSASGHVLELGLGTGLNLAHYPGSVRRITSIGPEATVDARAEKRARVRGITIDHLRGDACAMPFPDRSFDTVISTFVLCTVPDPAAALAEIARVLRPAGRLLFLEHVGAAKRSTRLLQEVLDPLMRRVNCGCRMTRDTLAALRAGGYDLPEIVAFRLPAMMPLYRDLIRGVGTIVR